MIDFPHRKILEQAYSITRQYKFLWGFGLFLVWGYMLVLSFLWGSIYQANDSASPQAVTSWAASNESVAFLTAAVGVFLLGIFIVLYYRSKVGLILAVKALVEKKETGFIKGLQASKPAYHKATVLSITFWFFILIVIAILSAPIFYLIVLGFIDRATMLGTLALIIFIPLSILGSPLSILSTLFVSLYELKIGASVKASFSLIAKKWLPLLTFAFLLWSIVITTLFISLFMVFLVLAPFIFTLGIEIYAIGVGLGLMFFLGVTALIAVFYLTAWVLAFEELIKPIKTEEEEPLVIPEAA